MKLTLHCGYCVGAGPEDGFLWTENNGPIARCPVCNPDSDTKRREREYQAALAQRAALAEQKDRTNEPFGLERSGLNTIPSEKDRTNG